MGKRHEQVPHHRRHTEDKQAYEPMFFVICHQRTANRAMKRYHHISTRMAKTQCPRSPSLGPGTGAKLC
jgi:hypothetical protein